MKLPALVSFFRTVGSFAEFCQLHGLDQASEVIEIYAQPLPAWIRNWVFSPSKQQAERLNFNLKV